MRAVVIHAAEDLRVQPVADEPVTAGMARVRIEAGGICGSDLKYFFEGGFGTVRLREPMILGHEVAGRIVAVGQNDRGLRLGDLVAVSPSRPCHACRFCAEKLYNHCANMAFYGSAMPMPHIQGAFRDELVADIDQCHKIADGIAPQIAAFAEPLAVVLHAISRAGKLRRKRVLITGCGPIGALAILATKAAGAAEVIVTDILDGVLDLARDLGADAALNATDPVWTAPYAADKGQVDVMIEASGSAAALQAGLQVLRPRGVLVQLGLGGEVALPLNVIVAKEIEMRGAFRFHAEFADAVALINQGHLPLDRLLTHAFPLSDAETAFRVAGDRSRSMKVQLDFTQ